MVSPGQKRGACGHLMAGSNPCLMKQECTLCNTLTTDQKSQLATLLYKLKKEKKADEKYWHQQVKLIDPDYMSVLRTVNTKPPEKLSKRSRRHRNPPHPSLLLTKTLKALERFSHHSDVGGKDIGEAGRADY